MKNSDRLRRELKRIDGKGYGRYGFADMEGKKVV